MPHWCPPDAESPFASLRCYLSKGSMHCYLNRHYPVLIAHTGSWARPKSSFRLRLSLLQKGLRRLLPVPAGNWPFPALSPQSLYRCLDPYPAASLWCTCPLLPKGQRPHLIPQRFGTPDDRRNATSTTGDFRGCSHFVMFRLPYSLDPQVAPTASTK